VQCPRASKDQLDKAVAAAKAAYPAWAATPIEERRKLVIKMAEAIEANVGELARLLDFFLLEKGVYELSYEANSRPDWVEVPAKGILDLLSTPP